jgi:hypothetical protein
MTANTPEPEASSSSVPAQPSAKPVANGDPTGQQPAVPASAGPTTASTSTGAAPTAAAGPTTAPSKELVKVAPPKAAPPPRKPPAGPRRSSTGAAAAVTAVASLLIAAGAIAIAVYALDVAREAKSQAAIAASGNQPPAAAPTAAPSPTVAPTPTPTTPAFAAELSGAVLRIPPAESLCASVYVDVDTLRIGEYTGHEFYVSRCQGQHVIRIDRKDGAVPTSPSPTPEMCASQLNGAASAPEIVLDVRAGLTFCVLTSKSDAQQQGMPQRLAIVEVRAVGSDQSLATVVSTYRVP